MVSTIGIVGITVICFGLGVLFYIKIGRKLLLLLKYRKKINEIKDMLNMLNNKYPENTKDNKIREERERMLIKSGYPLEVLNEVMEKKQKEDNKNESSTSVFTEEVKREDGTTESPTTTSEPKGGERIRLFPRG